MSAARVALGALLLLATPRIAHAQIDDAPPDRSSGVADSADGIDDEHPDSPRRLARSLSTGKDPDPSTLLLELYLGPSWRYLAAESFLSGHLGLIIGGRSVATGVGIGVRLEGEYGATVHGLRFGGFHLGPSVELRLRPGLHVEVTAPHLSGIFVPRVTSSEVLVALTIGASAALVVDLWGGPDGGNGIFAVRASLEGGEPGVSGTILAAFGWRIPDVP